MVLCCGVVVLCCVVADGITERCRCRGELYIVRAIEKEGEKRREKVSARCLSECWRVCA